MTSPINASSQSQPTQASTVEQQKAAGSQSQQVTGSTKIASLADLKKKAPKVWKQMMIGIAMNICHDAEKSNARIKEAMRKAREDAQG